MLPSNVQLTDRGFTLIESLIIVVIIGILSAIAVPSFLGMLNRAKVNNALNEAQGAFQEAQREAIRKSKSCTVTISTTNQKITSPCLVTGDRTFDSSVGLETNSSSTSIPFSYRGTITLNNGGTFVFFTKDNFTNKKCLVISSPLGIIRNGTYTGQIPANTANPVSADNCQK